MTIGTVTLVGAGPGDPDLLTLAALRELEAADAIIADRLIDPAVLRYARADAVIIDAGKQPDRHQLTQDQINETLIRLAREGKRVVRLKGGDPFVYGRGSEEADACHNADIPVRLIPGITSALAAPAAIGIPVTERGRARTFALATPAVGAGETLADQQIAALAAIDTISLLMGIAALEDTARRLIIAGKPASTPVAVVQDATLRHQRAVVGTLADIAQRVRDARLSPPAVVTIGAVADASRPWLTLRQPREGPLAGRSIVVTRPVAAGRRIAERLRGLGAEVIEAPLIRIEYIDPEPIQSPLDAFDWAVFTSLHGVRGFARYLEANELDARALAGVRVAAIGPKTAAELRAVGIRADLVPQEHRAYALVQEIRRQIHPSDTVLFPAGTLALEEIPTGLAELGAQVTTLRVYDTLPAELTSAARRAIDHGVDAVALYSPTAVRALAALDMRLDNTVVAAIGPTTAAEADRHGIPVHLIPDDYSDDGMAHAIRAALADHASPHIIDDLTE
ncbi:MAG: uroporphyrinogen-III C-methyltransferase [Phycisphaerales bacterium]